jgi:hypothetical protein
LAKSGFGSGPAAALEEPFDKCFDGGVSSTPSLTRWLWLCQ